MDEDGGGTIDRVEWISYLASPSGQDGGFFDYALKELFDEYDINNNGVIALEQFKKSVIHTFKKDIGMKSQDGKKAATEVVEALATEMFK